MITLALLLCLLLPPLALLAWRRWRPRRGRRQRLCPRLLLDDDAQILFRRLQCALPQYVILAQTRLEAFLEPAPGSGSPSSELMQTSTDFLICSGEFRVVAAVELEDFLRPAQTRQQVCELLQAAKVPLLRWNTANLPTLRDIQEAVAELETLRLLQIGFQDRLDLERLAAATSPIRREPRL